MKIAVASLSDRPTPLEATLSPKELDLTMKHTRFEAPVQVAVTVTRMQEDVLAEGTASTTATAECSRCLEDVPVVLHGDFEALYVPDTGRFAKRMDHPDFIGSGQRVNFYSELTIDLSDEIRQCVLLELPMKPLCRPNCVGLCPTCGANRNEGPCGCKPDKTDDPWEKLRALIPPDKK